MRISSNYLQLINRILTEEPGKPSGGSKRAAEKEVDRKELSRMVTALQGEMERIDEEAGMEKAARLEKLAEEIQNGTYQVDSKKLAEAMLKFFGQI